MARTHMQTFPPPLLLHFFLLPLTSILASPPNTTLLTFDSLSTTKGLAPLPNPYAHLSFSPSFSVFNPHSPAFTNLISPQDLNCATSSPNALLGSRSSSAVPASLAINTTSATEAGLQPFFSLESFCIKPLDAPRPGTEVWLRGYQLPSPSLPHRSQQELGSLPSRMSQQHDKLQLQLQQQQQPLFVPTRHEERRDEGIEYNVLDWHVFFPTGYHLPLNVRMHEFSGERWDRLHKVEMWADFGYDGLDWEFCVDDLRVGFSGGDGNGGDGDGGR